MAQTNLTQPTYVTNFTCMLGFMNDNQAAMQDQLTQAIAALAEA